MRCLSIRSPHLSSFSKFKFYYYFSFWNNLLRLMDLTNSKKFWISLLSSYFLMILQIFCGLFLYVSKTMFSKHNIIFMLLFPQISPHPSKPTMRQNSRSKIYGSILANALYSVKIWEPMLTLYLVSSIAEAKHTCVSCSWWPNLWGYS